MMKRRIAIILAVALFLSSTMAYAASPSISCTNAGSDSTGGTTHSETFSICGTPANGDLIIVFLQIFPPGASNNNCPDAITGPSGYTKGYERASFNNSCAASATSGVQSIWTHQYVTADPTSLTFSWNSGAPATADWATVDIGAGTYNTGTPVVFGTANNDTGSRGTTQTALQLTPNSLSDLILGTVMGEENITWNATPPSGWTDLQKFSTNAPPLFDLFKQTTTASPTGNAADTTTGGTFWEGVQVDVEASAATPTPTPTQTPTPTPTPTQTPTPVQTSIAQHPCFLGGKGGLCP